MENESELVISSDMMNAGADMLRQLNASNDLGSTHSCQTIVKRIYEVMHERRPIKLSVEDQRRLSREMTTMC